MIALKRRILLLAAISLMALVLNSVAFAAKPKSRSGWSSRAGASRQIKRDSSSVAVAPTGDAIVDKALSFRGSRYVYGGTSRGGFDCSGFTQYIYKRFGINIPRTAAAQSKVGTKVSRSELKPGDLMFFSTIRPGVSHVSMYIGNGKMVHAANRKRGVTVDSIFSSYYWNRFLMARRVR